MFSLQKYSLKFWCLWILNNKKKKKKRKLVGWLTGWWAYSRSRNQSATEHFICYLWFRLRFCTMNGQKKRIVLNGSKMVELAMKWWNESISRSRLHCANLIDILFMHECFVRFVYIFQIVITIESTNKSQKKIDE